MTATNTVNTDNIFDLTPEQFRTQEEAERNAAQERREAAARAVQEAAEATERTKAAVRVGLATLWRLRLSQIGERTNLAFEVRETGNEYRPCELIVSGVRVPVSGGFGQITSLEISLPWYTARYDSWRRRRGPAETCRSRVKKDGSFNYATLGAMAKRYVEGEIKYRADEGYKIRAAGVIKQLATGLSYSNIEPSTDPARPVMFKFSITCNMTADETRAAIGALRAAGLLAEPETKS